MDFAYYGKLFKLSSRMNLYYLLYFITYLILRVFNQLFFSIDYDINVNRRNFKILKYLFCKKQKRKQKLEHLGNIQLQI